MHGRGAYITGIWGMSQPEVVVGVWATAIVRARVRVRVRVRLGRVRGRVRVRWVGPWVRLATRRCSVNTSIVL